MDSTTDPFDVERLRIRDGGHLTPSSFHQEAPRQHQQPRIPRHNRGERFLKGPIPWRWLEVAARLPGRALAVALVLWHLIGLREAAAGTVRLSPSTRGAHWAYRPESPAVG